MEYKILTSNTLKFIRKSKYLLLINKSVSRFTKGANINLDLMDARTGASLIFTFHVKGNQSEK